MRKKSTKKDESSKKIETTEGIDDYTPRERALVAKLHQYWHDNPEELHEFRRAMYGEKIANWLWHHDITPPRYLQAAQGLIASASDDDLLDVEALAAQLREMSQNPDDPANKAQLRTIEYYLTMQPSRRSLPNLRR